MADMYNRIGQSIGEYRLLRLLGQGTFGTVYLAQHMHDHTTAAVKVLHVPLTSSNDVRAFLKEARMVRLRHPHILPILDFDLSSDNLPYLVMAYADGGTLRDHHPKGSRLSYKTIDTYVQQLASALQYAHDRHVIHRDIKPENILVYSDGTVLLSDFGIARIGEHTNLLTLHQVSGTPAYAAPEQTEGKPSLASDQYALAVVVYEWLTGERPFQGNPIAVALHHLRDAPPSLRSICPDVSLDVEQVVLKALAKAPQDRFPTITDFARALHIALQEEAVPTQLLPHPDEPPSVPFASPSLFLSEKASPEMISAELAFAPTEGSPLVSTVQPGTTSPDPKAVGIDQPASPTRQPRFSLYRSPFLVLLCFLLLLVSSGGAVLLVMVQRNSAHSSTLSASVATATAVVNAYWTGVADNGVQFGFDAAHTHANPYEKFVSAANVSILTQLWSFQTKDTIFSSPAVANGMVYVGSHDRNLYAFDANCRSNCQPLWSFWTGGFVHSSPAVANGVVYVGSENNNFYAFDANCRHACQPLWSFSTGGAIQSSPAVANRIVYVGSLDGKFYAFDENCRNACQPLWSFSTKGAIFSSPAVANGIVYIGSDDGSLYAFDAVCRSNCQPLWSFTAGGSIGSSPAVANSIVYVGSADHKLYAFDAACRSACQPLWSFQTGDKIGSSPAVTNGMVYVGSDDHSLYAFDAGCRSNCQPLWSIQTGDKIGSSPTVANGVLYVGSGDGKLYTFDAKCRSNCQPLWSFTRSPRKKPSPCHLGVLLIGRVCTRTPGRRAVSQD